MLNRTVSQARSFKQNPNHFPRKLNVRIYNALSRTQPKYPLPKNPKRILIQCQEKIGDGIIIRCNKKAFFLLIIDKPCI